MRPSDSGLTLIEVLFSLLVLGIALAGILPASWGAIRGMGDRREEVQARELAMELYEEIAALQVEGEAGEEGGSGAYPGGLGTRAGFTSVLEYNGLSEKPPLDPLGKPIPGAEGLYRSVSVRYVDPADTSRVLETERSHLVEVSVQVGREDRELCSIRFLKAVR